MSSAPAIALIANMTSDIGKTEHAAAPADANTSCAMKPQDVFSNVMHFPRHADFSLECAASQAVFSQCLFFITNNITCCK